jgi:hypothetical protein
MTKLSLLGIAAVAAYAALAVPAFAQHKTHFLNAYAQSCAGYEPGNPYNRDTDYWSWSAWRVRGGWEDASCAPTRMYRGEF